MSRRVVQCVCTTMLLIHCEAQTVRTSDVLYQNTTPIHSVAYRRRLIAEEEALGPAGVQEKELGLARSESGANGLGEKKVGEHVENV